MENQIKEDSELCVCPDTLKCEFIDHHGDTGDGDLIEIPVAHLCSKCGKLVDRQIIIIQGVKAKKPDWMRGEN
jgi:hypothetical protein